MKMFRLITILFLVIGNNAVNAQMERTMYQVFEVDSAKTIALDIVGIYEVHTWAGSSVLVETNIQIWDASREILGFLIKDGRYDVSMDSSAGPTPTELKIFTKIKERKPIKRLDGQKCLEIATAKIFIPDTFIISEDKKLLTRKEKPAETSGG
ncbi:MAG: hypothetical protein KA138_11000 [Saprospiraceae bacterium]|jgi:hypothetical protein|nr:hypothetical protein [Saprospiraceae bacterium]